jgi:hypothetical protein
MTDRESNTLATRGLEEPYLFSSCAVVSVFCSGGWFYILLMYLEYHMVVGDGTMHAITRGW